MNRKHKDNQAPMSDDEELIGFVWAFIILIGFLLVMFFGK